MYFFIFQQFVDLGPLGNKLKGQNFGKTIFLDFFRFLVSVLGDCKIEINIENRIKIGHIHFELCLFLFFVTNVNLTNLVETQILDVC